MTPVSACCSCDATFHRTLEDLSGLTFRQWQAQKGEILVVNSSELRAVQGHQKNDFRLQPINPPKLRQKTARSAKKGLSVPGEVEYGPRQMWGLDPDIDRDTRKFVRVPRVCVCLL